MEIAIIVVYIFIFSVLESKRDGNSFRINNKGILFNSPNFFIMISIYIR
jgi:hypothetical protein